MTQILADAFSNLVQLDYTSKIISGLFMNNNILVTRFVVSRGDFRVEHLCYEDGQLTVVLLVFK